MGTCDISLLPEQLGHGRQSFEFVVAVVAYRLQRRLFVCEIVGSLRRRKISGWLHVAGGGASRCPQRGPAAQVCSLTATEERMISEHEST